MDLIRLRFSTTNTRLLYNQTQGLNTHLDTYSFPVPWTVSSPPANSGVRSMSPDPSASLHLHVLGDTKLQATAEAACTWVHWNTTVTSTKNTTVSTRTSMLYITCDIPYISKNKHREMNYNNYTQRNVDSGVSR